MAHHQEALPAQPRAEEKKLRDVWNFTKWATRQTNKKYVTHVIALLMLLLASSPLNSS